MIVLDTIELPEEMMWFDEQEWSNLRSAIRYTLQGKMIRENSSILASKGRPITLGSENAWITKADLDTLREWSQIVNHQMSLTMHDSSVYVVGFRLWEAPVLTVENMFQTAFPSGTTLYRLTELRLAVV